MSNSFSLEYSVSLEQYWLMRVIQAQVSDSVSHEQYWLMRVIQAQVSDSVSHEQYWLRYHIGSLALL